MTLRRGAAHRPARQQVGLGRGRSVRDPGDHRRNHHRPGRLPVASRPHLMLRAEGQVPPPTIDAAHLALLGPACKECLRVLPKPGPAPKKPTARASLAQVRRRAPDPTTRSATPGSGQLRRMRPTDQERPGTSPSRWRLCVLRCVPGPCRRPLQRLLRRLREPAMNGDDVDELRPALWRIEQELDQLGEVVDDLNHHHVEATS
jgi:hypothetical protein